MNTDIWISEDNWTFGVEYKNEIFNNDHGTLRMNIRYNYRQYWENKTPKGLVNFGVNYTIK